MINIVRKFDRQALDSDRVAEALLRLLNGPSANPGADREAPGESMRPPEAHEERENLWTREILP